MLHPKDFPDPLERLNRKAMRADRFRRLADILNAIGPWLLAALILLSALVIVSSALSAALSLPDLVAEAQARRAW